MTKYENLGNSMRYHDRLKVKCLCGHEASFSQKDAIEVFGKDATYFDIRGRMRCSKCKETGLVEVWV